MPAVRMAARALPAAATPTIKLAVEINPSFAPRTAARSHDARPPRWRSAARWSGRSRVTCSACHDFWGHGPTGRARCGRCRDGGGAPEALVGGGSVQEPLLGRVDDLEALDLVRYPALPLMRRAFELRDNVTAFDAVYVALAERLDRLFVIADQRLAVTRASTARSRCSHPAPLKRPVNAQHPEPPRPPPDRARGVEPRSTFLRPTAEGAHEKRRELRSNLWQRLATPTRRALRDVGGSGALAAGYSMPSSDPVRGPRGPRQVSSCSPARCYSHRCSPTQQTPSVTASSLATTRRRHVHLGTFTSTSASS